MWQCDLVGELRQGTSNMPYNARWSSGSLSPSIALHVSDGSRFEITSTYTNDDLWSISLDRWYRPYQPAADMRDIYQCPDSRSRAPAFPSRLTGDRATNSSIDHVPPKAGGTVRLSTQLRGQRTSSGKVVQHTLYRWYQAGRGISGRNNEIGRNNEL